MAAAKELGTNAYQISLSLNTPGRQLRGSAGRLWVLKDAVASEDDTANEEEEEEEEEETFEPPPPMAALGDQDQAGEPENEQNEAIFSGSDDDDGVDGDGDGDGQGLLESNENASSVAAAADACHAATDAADAGGEDSWAVVCTVMLVAGLGNLLGMLAQDFVFDMEVRGNAPPVPLSPCPRTPSCPRTPCPPLL